MKKYILSLVLAAVLGAASLSVALELDRRRMLNAAEHKPWRGVGQVNVAGFSSRSMCTGTLIGEDLVLTAAHCVMSAYTGKPYRPGDVNFVAGYRLGQKVGHSKAKAIAVHPDYVLSAQAPIEQVATDIALIRLADPIPAEKAPWFALGPAPSGQTPLTVISYRQDRPNALTRQRGCDLVGTRGALIQLGCSVTFGASGSPVFMGEGEEPRIVAVLAAKGTDARHPAAFAVLVERALDEVRALLD
ncbi:MAG: S1 family peptidase [Paracoccaceae bacterium]|nr:S1 family peptidase [Paracoccaceae bacterium]